MAAVARYLADTSVLARLHHPEVAAAFAPLIESGVVATYGVIEFELGWATQSSAEFDQVRADRDAGYEWLATHDEDWRRALDVQAALRRLVKFCTKRFRGNAAEAAAEANVSGREPCLRRGCGSCGVSAGRLTAP